MAPKTLPSRDLVRQLLNYDPASGEFTWRHRPQEMFPTFKGFKIWNGKYADKKAGGTMTRGYRTITVEYESFLGHRLAWLLMHGEPVPAQIDHINRNPSDNRISNLRAATYSQNIANTGMWSHNRSGFRGVHSYFNRFYAQIRHEGRTIYLGSFLTIEEARDAYRAAAVRLFGEFANTD